MRLVTVGVAGSFPGPRSPASTYLLQVPGELAAASGLTGADARDWNVVLDLGNGGLGALQRHVDPNDLDAVGISHMHPDHSADLSGLYVYLKYHPERGVARTGRPRHLPVLGPADVAERAGVAYGLEPGETMEGVFDFGVWQPGRTVRVGPLRSSRSAFSTRSRRTGSASPDRPRCGRGSARRSPTRATRTGAKPWSRRHATPTCCSRRRRSRRAATTSSSPAST